MPICRGHTHLNVQSKNNTPTIADPLDAGLVGSVANHVTFLLRVAWQKVGGSTLWAVLSSRFGEAGSQLEPCTGYCWST